MVDKIAKALNKLTAPEKRLIKKILLQLQDNEFENLNVKKLKGRDDIYRIRKGKIRIIFRITNKKINLLTIERRSDRTYKEKS